MCADFNRANMELKKNIIVTNVRKWTFVSIFDEAIHLDDVHYSWVCVVYAVVCFAVIPTHECEYTIWNFERMAINIEAKLTKCPLPALPIAKACEIYFEFSEFFTSIFCFIHKNRRVVIVDYATQYSSQHNAQMSTVSGLIIKRNGNV